MMLSAVSAAAAVTLLVAVATDPVRAAEAPGRTDVRVTTVDGVGLRVRALVPARVEPGLPLVLVHGARVPGVASFDLDVPGGSLAADLALRLQRPVFVMDARGYGGSDRPAAMDHPAAEAPPLSRGHEVVRDIDAVATAVMERTGAPCVALLGWATGGMWAAWYASLWPERVGALVVLNALYGGSARHPSLGPGSPSADPVRPDRLNPAIGAYRWNPAASLLPSWDATIPLADKSAWRDDAVAAAYVREALASDPRAAGRDPPAFRAPLGAIEDSFLQAGGRRLFDAGSITAPVLVVRSERDFWSRPEDASAFVHDAVRARSLRVVTLPGATHYVHLDRPERGRDAFLDEVVGFLRAVPADGGPR
ncbi:alpha/beta fold hydrolase [Rhodoplanes sp. TEM]|uniref:Alpha/beta fold hydrolase n=1 Tax=Rhodoplanes tepidamans TaxID=200616 RepID=A0ABT5J7F0_RHOTP|nr:MULTISPECIES: alpha/beta fold hydrolase [Rhodoplanes]MDC7785575.1 alpha/beta fold hydrolase [Rhodoplanes tepidamans]MDC7985226.1 alpha/beta fold hydrolase [Rhodoplanes sp. TEM]MDQ0353255.1 pimeloyl-ACP methyl ester carboxylesterase [Rhodoplanes tepidamans]